MCITKDEIMVGTLVLDFGSHLIVFKVAICMHKLKYWFLLQVYPLTNTRILYFLLNDSLLICTMIVTRRTNRGMLNKGREHYLLSFKRGIWCLKHHLQSIWNQEIGFLISLQFVFLQHKRNCLIRRLKIKYWILKSTY